MRGEKGINEGKEEAKRREEKTGRGGWKVEEREEGEDGKLKSEGM